MMRPSVAVFCSVLLLSAGCGDIDLGGDAVKGSGTVVSETRPVTGFEGVSLVASGEVVIDVGVEESLTIETDDNILPLLTSEVRNGVLELSTDESINATELTFRIGVPSLDLIEIIGSGDIIAVDVGGGSLEARIVGAGTITVSGAVDEANVAITGAGDFLGEDLTADTCNVEIAGSGDAVVNVTASLDVSITGTGDVEYIGTPRVNTSITGTGDVSPR